MMKLSALLFAVCSIVFLLCGRTFFGYDGEIMYRVAESMVQRHSIQIIDPIYHANQPYSAYAVGLSLLMVPLVALGTLLLHDPRALVTLLEPALTAGTVVALTLLLTELGSSRRRSLMIALAYAFGTLAWHYSGTLFTEPATAFTLTVGVLGLVRYHKQAGPRWLLLAGAMVGIAVTMRWDAVLTVAAPVGLAAGWLVLRQRGGWREHARLLALFGAPVLAAIAINAGYDLARFGQLFGGPYSTDPLGFSTPLLTGVYGLLASPGVGLFVYTPVLLISLLAYRNFARRWRMEAVLVAALLLIRVLLYARFWSWDGGATWGPRFLVPLLPLLFVPLAFLPKDRRLEIAAVALAVVGVGVQVLGQLVPYGLYYATVVPHLTTQLGFCQGCAPYPGPQSQAVSRITDFDWHYAPIVVQLKLLAHGVMAPAWAPIALVVPVLLAGVTLLTRRVFLIAADLDRPALEKAA